MRFRTPRAEDGARIWSLVRESGALDLNSSYTYLMLCKFFGDTCVVAEEGGRVVGFVSAFHQPEAPAVLFVWQVAVARTHRNEGVATDLLKELLQREACADTKYLEATVSPSNGPSQALFNRLAQRLDTRLHVSECFPEAWFPQAERHEAEMMFRIGPLSTRR